MKNVRVLKLSKKKSHNAKANRERRKPPKATNASARKAVAPPRATVNQATAPSYKVHNIAIAKIKVVGKRRVVDPEKVKRLVESIRTLGLRMPVTIRPLDSGPQLVAGLHRLEAAKILEWKTIPCEEIRGGKIIAEMWQISENLDRTGLTTQEEDEAIARWVELWNSLQPPSSEHTEEGGRGRRKGSISDAARHLPVKGKSHDAKRNNIERALKRNSIHPDAKKAASEAGIVDRSKLNEIANQKTPEAQLDKVRDLKAGSRNTDSKNFADSAPDVEPSFEVVEREWKKARNLRLAWKRASLAVRTRFVKTVLKYPLNDN